jgi:aryl-alcohol dehydrogenase-like predicted oxidoreductase
MMEAFSLAFGNCKSFASYGTAVTSCSITLYIFKGATMQKRQLRDLSVSVLGLGCMGMSESYGPSNDDESISTIHRFLDLGGNFIDTADTYGPFKNEELIAKAIIGRRESVVLATKFGNERGNDGSFKGVNGRPEYVRAACDASLQRLGVEFIDLYYQHRVDRTVPVEETWGALKELVEAGKVRHLGISEASATTIERANSVHPITAVQSEWSLWSRDIETNGVLAKVRELGIGFVPYSPLGRGFLTGAMKSFDDLAPNDRRRTHPRFKEENFAKNFEIVAAVKALADQRGVTTAQLALAWVLAQGEDIVPIPGTRKVSRLEENIAAIDIVLTAQDRAELEAAAPIGVAAGDRYPDMSAVNV